MLRAVGLITSMRNARLRRVRELASDAEARRRHGLYLVEGPEPLGEILTAGGRPVEVFASERLRRDAHGPPLLAALEQAGIPPAAVSERVLERVAPTRHGRGVLALLPLPSRPEDPDAVLSRPGLALVLEGVQDPGNLGTIVRCAEAFEAAGVLALEGCADPWGPKAARAAAGALERLPVRRPSGWGPLLESLGRSDRTLVAAEARGGRPPWRLAGSAPRALLLGAEGRGLSPEALERCAERVTIPLAPGVDSLNVAAAAAVLLYALSGAPRPGQETTG
jgi:TrmH family RNA methyltransferase